MSSAIPGDSSVVAKASGASASEERAPAFDQLLDASGLFCPEPVMLLHNAVRDIAVGAVLKVVATDPSTRRDIPKFCRFLGHDLLLQQETNGQFLYFIRKGT